MDRAGRLRSPGVEGRVPAQHRPGSEVGRKAMGLGNWWDARACQSLPGGWGPPPRVTADAEFSDFIVDKDKHAVGSGTEPPEQPVEGKHWSVGQELEGPERAGAEDSVWELSASVCGVGSYPRGGRSLGAGGEAQDRNIKSQDSRA